MSSIEWTDATWNPVTGCSKVSAGCKNCYAERLAPRVFAGQHVPDGSDRVDTITGPRRRPRRFTDVRTHPERLVQPLRWRKPRRVFVNSMSDLFHEDVPDEFVDQVFAVMVLAPQHVFQVLTKRADRMRRYVGSNESLGRVVAIANEIAQRSGLEIRVELRDDGLPGMSLGNAWLGVSCENQEAANERIPLLLETPAAVRFVSAEPLLGPIDFRYIRDGDEPFSAFRPRGQREPCDTLGLDWVIVGGESGHSARACDAAWIRYIVGQCRDAGVACFVKQLGAVPVHRGGESAADRFMLQVRDRKGGDPSEWPEDLRVREFPEAGA